MYLIENFMFFEILIWMNVYYIFNIDIVLKLLNCIKFNYKLYFKNFY